MAPEHQLPLVMASQVIKGGRAENKIMELQPVREIKCINWQEVYIFQLC
jgi:hypothetical protein